MAEDTRAKVLALVELAVGRGTPPHEAAAAATAACRRIHAEDLLGYVLPSATSKDRGLLSLAIGVGVGGEARGAAIALCRKIKDEGPSRVRPARPARPRPPRREDEYIDLDDVGAPERGYEGEDDPGDVVIVAISFIILNQSDEVYRVARLQPPQKHSSHILLIPKRYVRNVVMMTTAESQAIGWGQSGNIIKNLTLVRSYFEEARIAGWDHWQ